MLGTKIGSRPPPCADSERPSVSASSSPQSGSGSVRRLQGCGSKRNSGSGGCSPCVGPVEPPRDVAVVSIDKTSLDQLGLTKDVWPPSRHIHARVIRSLSRHGVSAIVMDVFFKVRRTAAEDDDLAKAIAESGNVALFESVERIRFAGGEIVQTRSPIEPFRDAALATAAFPLPDWTAVRFFWSFVDATAGKVPTLPAVALQIYALPHLDRLRSLLGQVGAGNLTDLPSRVTTGEDSRRLMNVLRRDLGSHPDAARRALTVLEHGTEDGLTAGERSVLAALVRLYAGGDTHYLNFYGPPGHIRTIPFHRLLSDSENSRLDLKGAVVFVGEGASEFLSNADQRDTYRTDYSDDGVDLSGAEIAATAFANLLTNRTLRRVSFGAEAGILICFGLVAAVLARILPAFYAAGAILALGCAHTHWRSICLLSAPFWYRSGFRCSCRSLRVFLQPFSSDTAISAHRCRAKWIPVRHPNWFRESAWRPTSRIT